MIGHSIANVLGLKNPKRIVFHEITKNAIANAIKNPRTINYNMVHAQQARRLLDRLVGYMISPILWKYLISDGKSQSAGRVQSVVVRIVIDKENTINDSISSPYLKTIGEFKLNDGSKMKSTLMHNNKLYSFESEEKAKEFISTINKKTIFKVISVNNRESIRKPSPPFITSSLQQEASTKLHYNVKRTMDIAQKLYEAGHITYMRTDSPNISKDILNDIEKYIVDKYGKEYSDIKNYESKNANAQEAHECIRPTHIEIIYIDNMDADANKLYSLIWKRTVASQMANAIVNVQTIQIDGFKEHQNNNSSILNFNNIKCTFNTVIENVIFPGYLIDI
jgi:DNA topoisomerase-1